MPVDKLSLALTEALYDSGRRGRRSVIFLIDQDDRDRCRQRLRKHHPELKKLIRVTHLAGNDLVLEQVHEQIRVRREVSTLKELPITEGAKVD